MKDINNKIRELIESAYTEGYKDGKSLEYDLGLNDAWECARKMMLSDEDGGIALSDILKIFGMTQYSAIKRFSASEVMKKIKEYGEKQKRTCDTCQYVGNTLYNLKTYCANCDGRNGWTPKQTEQRCKSKMTIDEAITHCEEVADSKCDECGAEHRQLAEWLKELKRLREQTRWIPVSEGLPNKDKYTDFYKCLVAVSCTSRNDICDSITAYFDGKHFYRHLYDRATISGVKAWMPLPETYKAESEVKNESLHDESNG